MVSVAYWLLPTLQLVRSDHHDYCYDGDYDDDDDDDDVNDDNDPDDID